MAILLLAAAPAAAWAQSRLEDGERRLELNGVEQWVRVAGARHGTTPIVVVHGGPGGSVYNFERTAGPLLEASFTVVYYEQRGSGRSAAPADSAAYSIPLLLADLEALRTALGVERLVPLGFSFGAELALEYALAHPERVEALVLQSPTVGDWEHTQRTQLRGFLAVARGEMLELLRVIASSDAPLEERWMATWGAADEETVDRLLFHDREAAGRNRELWREAGLAQNPAFYFALRRQPPPPAPLLQRARGLTAPALVIVGLHDRNVGVDVPRDLAAILPEARLVVFEESAHFPDAEETERYVREVRGFLGGS